MAIILILRNSHKIGVIDKIILKALICLKSSKEFSVEVITDLSRENFFSGLNYFKYDGNNFKKFQN